MPSFISQFGSWMAVAAFVVFGVVAIYGLFDKRKREVKSEENTTEDRLIKLFKEEQEQLNKRLTDQDRVIDELKKKVDKMTHENELLVAVLQGKDEASKQFQKDAYESMAKLNLVFEQNKGIGENLGKLITLLDRRMVGTEVK